jgi:CheY-like chemotaxis protein
MAARILLVEDDPDAQSFDLLLADNKLADGSGLEIADEAKAAGIKTAIITGNALNLPPDTEDRHALMLKPLRARELLSAIEDLLGDPDARKTR